MLELIWTSKKGTRKMKSFVLKSKKAGFTLLEMLVVIAIIAGLAVVLLPMFGDVSEKAATAADAANQSDLTRQIMSFSEINKTNPNQLDSLLDLDEQNCVYGDDDATTGCYTAADTAEGALWPPFHGHNQVSGDFTLTSLNLQDNGNPNPFLNPGLVAWHSLQAMGITEVWDHDRAAANASNSARRNAAASPIDPTPNDVPRELVSDATTDSFIAVLNRDDSDADGVLDNTVAQGIYEHFGIHVQDPTDPTDFTPTGYIAAFGVGPESSLVGNTRAGVMEAPLSASMDSEEYYGRYVALYDVSGFVGKFLGVITPKGNLLEATYDEYTSL